MHREEESKGMNKAARRKARPGKEEEEVREGKM